MDNEVDQSKRFRQYVQAGALTESYGNTPNFFGPSRILVLAISASVGALFLGRESAPINIGGYEA